MYDSSTHRDSGREGWNRSLLARISPALAAALAAFSPSPVGGRGARLGASPCRRRVLAKSDIRDLLRRRGYCRVYHLRLDRHAYVVRAWDRHGRHVRLRLNPFTGHPIRRPGYGIAWLTPAAVETRLAQHGFRRISGIVLRDGAYLATAEDPEGWHRAVRVDALSGAIWY